MKTLPRLVSAALSERMRVMPAVVVTPGRFLLTSSANLLLMRQVSESLAGRASYLTLWSMTRREQRGLGRRWEELLDTPDDGWRDLLGDEKDSAEDWRMLARHGGFPTPALKLTTTADRRIWFDGYVRTYLERELQDLAAISGLTGIAMHLAETEEPGGAHLENLVLHDLLAWRDARIERAELSYWRTSTGEEVDFVIEAGGKLEWLAPDVLAAPWGRVL